MVNKREEKNFVSKKNIIIFLIIVLAFGILGTTLSLEGEFILTTEYYDNPLVAIEKMDIQENISKGLELIKFDANNGAYLTITTDRELLLAMMRIHDEKYHFTGNYCVYDLDSLGDQLKSGEVCFNEATLYNKKGLSNGKLKYAVLFEIAGIQSDYIIRDIKIQETQEIWFVYKKL